MRLSDNRDMADTMDTQPSETVFITGGNSGIGFGLAQAFHARGAHVILAGRNADALKSAAIHYPGMSVEVLDMADEKSIADCALRVAERYPNLTTVINNAGIQQILDFNGDQLPAADLIAKEVNTNLVGLIQLTAALLPVLKAQPSARLINMGSGLGFVPLSAAPVYSATKAAVHSFSVSLRHQLAKTSVKVIEIIPPVVTTNLHRGQSRKPPNAMSVDDFVRAVMRGLDAGRMEIPVGMAKALLLGQRILPNLFFRIINK